MKARSNQGSVRTQWLSVGAIVDIACRMSPGMSPCSGALQASVGGGPNDRRREQGWPRQLGKVWLPSAPESLKVTRQTHTPSRTKRPPFQRKQASLAGRTHRQTQRMPRRIIGNPTPPPHPPIGPITAPGSAVFQRLLGRALPAQFVSNAHPARPPPQAAVSARKMWMVPD